VQLHKPVRDREVKMQAGVVRQLGVSRNESPPDETRFRSKHPKGEVEMIKIGHNVVTGYGVHISGNDGEEELSIFLSPSQSFRTPLIAVAMQIDGGAEIVENIPLEDGLKDKQLPKMLKKIIVKWASGGIKPSKKEKKQIEKKAKSAANDILDHVGIQKCTLFSTRLLYHEV
jgi:hypothetical protein